MDYGEWEKSVPGSIKGDPLWKVQVYRLALYAAEIGWADVTKLAQDRRTWSMSDQLNRALGSISSNFAEGYSRSSGKDRARFFEYSLGSARESRDWYYKARHILGEEVSNKRMELMASIIRLLLVTVPAERDSIIKEEGADYDA